MEIDIILNEFATPSEAAELGLLAESYGLRGVWSSNYGDSRDAFLALSQLALQSERIVMGPLAVSPYELHPLKMANSLFSLNEMCGGRAMICVGGGGAVAQSIGKKREHMTGHVKETLEILKSASPEEKLNYQGNYYTTYNYQPKWATDKPPLIYYGANHPKNMKLATRLADGLMTSDFCVPLMNEFIQDIHASLQEQGRNPQDFRISNFWAWHIKDDEEASWREARRELILRGYLGEKYFAPILDSEELKMMRDHFQDFLNAFLWSTDVIENVPEELVVKMIKGISFVGGLDAMDHALETLKAFAAGGLTEIALRVHDDPADAIKLIGEQVAPVLRD